MAYKLAHSAVAGRAAAAAGRAAASKQRASASAAPLPLLALLLLLLLAALPGGAQAKVTYTRLMRDDRGLIPVAPDFAFGEEGRVEITLKELSIWQRHEAENDVNYQNFGFLLLPVVQDEDPDLASDLAAGKCLLEGREPLLLFDHSSVAALIEGKATNVTVDADIEQGGWNFLYFVNCEPGAAVSFKSRIAIYNVAPGGKRDYLSVGETELSELYWAMFALFGALTVGWLVLLAKRRAHAHRIHALMAALLLCKTLTLFSQALLTEHVERRGEADGWNVAYYLFTTARGLLFFVVVVLIGSGWSYMKPFMDDNTRRILLIVVPLQVFANVALVFIDEESPAALDWLTWRDIFHLVDIAACCAILFPIVAQIKHLRDAAHVDGKAARALAKLKLFRAFYVVVVGYVYFSRIIVYLLRNTVQYTYAWLTDAAAELGALAFYVWVGVSFRPHQDNAYFKLEQEDIELATAY